MRPRVILVLAVAAVLLGGVMLVPAAYARLADDGHRHRAATTAGASPCRARRRRHRRRHPGRRAGLGESRRRVLLLGAAGPQDRADLRLPKNIAATNSTESMIKVWLVSDYLRRLRPTAGSPTAERLKQASAAIRDSDDNAAESLLQRRRAAHRSSSG